MTTRNNQTSDATRRNVRTASASAMLENLESRRLMSVSLSGGILSIKGTGGADGITVYPSTMTMGMFTVPSITVSGASAQNQKFVEALVSQVKIDTGNGNDVINVWVDQDSLVLAGGGSDKVYTMGGNDDVWADMSEDPGQVAGGDTVHTGLGNDMINSGNGEDFLYGEYGDDDLIAGDDNDWIFGSDGEDTLDGGGGNDNLDGGKGFDHMYGGIGNDRFSSQDGWSDNVDGGDGWDTIVEWDKITSNADYLTSIEAKA